MESETFATNMLWNLEQVAVQVGHAEKVKTRARSGYYKSAIMLSAAIVESLAFKILEKNSNLEMPEEDWRCVRSHPLPKEYRGEKGGLSICERIKPRFELDKHTDFKRVNEVCLNLKLFSEKLFEKIEKVRKLRNRIHIQGLSNIDRSYTKKELEFVGSVMDELMDVL